MALVEVEEGPSEDKYWKPEEKGDYVEGYLYKFEKGDYGKQIVLYNGVISFTPTEAKLLSRLP